MFAGEERKITERIKLQFPTVSKELLSPIFGLIWLHMSVSSVLIVLDKALTVMLVI